MSSPSMPPTFKQRLAAGEPLRVFALARLADPLIVEMFGLAGGYDGFWFDAEHATLSSERIIACSLAARANGFDSFVRMPPVGYWRVSQVLEAGAGGVMAAQIHTAEEAEEFVQWAKFAPRGRRGLNAGGRDGDYSHKPAAQFVVDANRDNFVAIQVETIGSVDEADAIAAIDGVDLLFVGPADLSLALGVVGDFHHEKLWQAIARVASACERHGKHWGCVAPDPRFAERAAELDCRMLTMGNDILALRRGIASIQDAFGRQFG